MIWSSCFFGAITIWIIALILCGIVGKKGERRGSIVTPRNIIFGGVLASSTVLFVPIYSELFARSNFSALKTIIVSLHNAIRLFICDGDFTFVVEHSVGAPAVIADYYILLTAVLYVVAPVFTFGFVLSFFKNISAYKKYVLSYFADIYVFSELNEKALILAADLKKTNPKRKIIFTDVFDTNDEPSYEGIKKAMELGAILFKKDIAVVDYRFHSKKSKITFFIIGEDDDENIQQTYSLWENYKDRESTYLYVFTTSVNSELLFQALGDGKMKVRRINEVYSVISRHLYDQGSKIFESASAVSEKEKVISAVVLGLGQYGTEMLKAMVWFCQMDGYRIEVHAFDEDPQAELRIANSCPELLDNRYNGNITEMGDAAYTIHIHTGVNMHAYEWKKHLAELSNVTYVFVGLDSDDKNIETALEARAYLLKQGKHPVIDAIVWNSDKNKALQNITNYKKQAYDINFIGDSKTSYSEKVVLYSDVEEIALQRHLRYGEEKDFWQYEYNYRSSIASAIHKKMKQHCGLPGIEKDIADRTEEERESLRRLEHCRWNAYMRTIGYSYGKVRDDIAKTHPCLVPFYELPKEEQEKDDD